MTKFNIGDRVREFIPFLGHRTGRIVRADQDAEPCYVWEDDSDGTRRKTTNMTRNLTTNPPRHEEETE